MAQHMRQMEEALRQMEEALQRDLREIEDDKYEGFSCPNQTCIIFGTTCWRGTPNEDQNGNLWMPKGYPECHNCGEKCSYKRVLFSLKFIQA